MEANPVPSSLADLPLGGRGRVKRVHLQDQLADRLGELGLCPGTEVAFIRRAPLGDPLVFRLRGYQLCLRRKEAALVEIEPLTQE